MRFLNNRSPAKGFLIDLSLLLKCALELSVLVYEGTGIIVISDMVLE